MKQMRNNKEQLTNKSGGFNVTWLILVQAAAFNILFPTYLIGGAGLFLVGLGVYLVALAAVAKKMVEPTPAYGSMDIDELIETFNARQDELMQYKKIPAELRAKFTTKPKQKKAAKTLLTPSNSLI